MLHQSKAEITYQSAAGLHTESSSAAAALAHEITNGGGDNKHHHQGWHVAGDLGEFFVGFLGAVFFDQWNANYEHQKEDGEYRE